MVWGTPRVTCSVYGKRWLSMFLLMVCDLPWIVREIGHSPSLEWSDLGQVCWYTLIISALGLLRQDPVFVASLCCEFCANLGSRDPFHQRQAVMIKFGYGDIIIIKKGLREGWGTLQSLWACPKALHHHGHRTLEKWILVSPQKCTQISLPYSWPSTPVESTISRSEILRNRLTSWLCGSESVLLIQGIRVLSLEPTCRECKENQLP